MKTINLFVACPKDSDNLKSLKESIKKKCLNLNVYFAEKIKEENEDRKIKVIPVTYDDPERREEVCKQIIKHRADIVLFLFDNVYDKYLLDELKYAVELSIKFHKPEPLVYVNKNNDNSTNIDLDKEIAEILAEGGWIFEPFIDSGDLWGKVLDKMERYFNQYYSIRRIQRKAKWRYYSLPLAIVMIIIGVACFACRPLLRNKVESRQLLIMGGGSAINYIVEHAPTLKSKDDLNTIRWHYAAMASGNAYGLIAEEVIKNYDGYKSHPYYPIVLSAQRASENDFLKTSNNKGDFNKTGIVIGVFLGYDWLVAYGSNEAFPKPDSIIRVDLLNKIIADQVLLLKSQLDSVANDSIVSNARVKIKPTTIYTTSENSGTLNTYKEICDSSIIQYNDLEHHIFSDIVTLSDNQGKEWVALGSKYYHPLDISNAVSLTLHDSIDRIILKPIYIYFMLYRQDEAYILPRATKRFLKKIQLPDTMIDSLNNTETVARIINDSTILYDNIFKNH